MGTELAFKRLERLYLGLATSGLCPRAKQDAVIVRDLRTRADLTKGHNGNDCKHRPEQSNESWGGSPSPVPADFGDLTSF